jgi:hypothetical protein
MNSFHRSINKIASLSQKPTSNQASFGGHKNSSQSPDEQNKKLRKAHFELKKLKEEIAK